MRISSSVFRIHNAADDALYDFQEGQHQLHAISNDTFGDSKTDEELKSMLRLFQLGKAAAGLHDADNEKEHQKGQADRLQCSVNINDYGPYASAFE